MDRNLITATAASLDALADTLHAQAAALRGMISADIPAGSGTDADKPAARRGRPPKVETAPAVEAEPTPSPAAPATADKAKAVEPKPAAPSEPGMTPGELAVAAKTRFTSLIAVDTDAAVEVLKAFNVAKFSLLPAERHAEFYAATAKALDAAQAKAKQAALSD